VIWAITAYFNPAGYRSRLRNYRIFRQHLRVPLLAVECSFGRPFELTPADADMLIQISDGDVMWQKERLLNVAIESLPPECTAVAWLDCDIVFGDGAWPERALAALENAALVHLFRGRHHPPPQLPPDEFDTAAIPLSATSTVHLVQSGASAPRLLEIAGNQHGWTNGLAWAASRDLLAGHGLYDALILGSGDRAILSAAFGCFDVIERSVRMDASRYRHFLAWARPFREAVGGRLGAIEGAIFHLWHGEVADRRYHERHHGMAHLGFDPHRDIARTPGGSWRWSAEKPELHAYVRDYFRSRNEDG
jgi:hypothetical protein